MGLLNPGGPIAQFKRNRCSISPVELILQSGVRKQENLIWSLDHAENELWKQPTDPVLEAVAKIVSSENREWEGSPTELAQAIQTDMAVNRLTKHLNVNASRLLEEHQVKYENKTKHAGRRIRLTYMVVEAPAFEVIE